MWVSNSFTKIDSSIKQQPHMKLEKKTIKRSPGLFGRVYVKARRTLPNSGSPYRTSAYKTAALPIETAPPGHTHKQLKPIFFRGVLTVNQDVPSKIRIERPPSRKARIPFIIAYDTAVKPEAISRSPLA